MGWVSNGAEGANPQIITLYKDWHFQRWPGWEEITSETSCRLCHPYPLLSMRLCFFFTKYTDLRKACRNQHGDQTSPAVFCLLVAFLFSVAGGRRLGWLGFYCGYLQESLTGITEVHEANSQVLCDFEGPVYQSHRDSRRSWGTRT